MNAHQNRYQVWLGLPAGTTNPNYYELLNISRSERDVTVIQSAAHWAANRVRNHRPEVQTPERQQLLDEIAAAGACLTDPRRRAEYDRRLAEGETAARPKGGIPAPPPSASPVSRPAAVPMASPVIPGSNPENSASPANVYGASPSGSTMTGSIQPSGYTYQAGDPNAPYNPQGTNPRGGTSYGAGYSQASPMTPFASSPRPVQPGSYPTNQASPLPPQPTRGIGGSPRPNPSAGASAIGTKSPRATSSTAKLARHRASQSKNMPIVAFTAGGILLALGALLLLGLGKTTSDPAKNQDTRSVARAVGENTPKAPATKPPRRTSKQSASAKPGSGGNPTTPKSQPAQTTDTDSVEASSAPQTVVDDGSPISEPDELPPATELTIPAEENGATETPRSGTDVTESPQPVTPMAQSPAPEEMTPRPVPTASGEPAASPVPPPALSPATASDIAKVEDGMKAAFAALRRYAFGEAMSQLDSVRAIPKSAELEEQFLRLDLLAQYARNFRESLSEAVASLQGGSMIELGNNRAVGVVETFPDAITVRVAESNRKYSFDHMPEGLAIAIADKWLDKSDPVSLVLKAAYLATLANPPQDRLEKAREWFAEAKRRGVDIEGLDGVFDDFYFQTPPSVPESGG